MLEWLKDKTYYKHKYNTAKVDIKVNRDVYIRGITDMTKKLEEKEAEVLYWKKSATLRNETIKKQKDRIKELEESKGGRKKNIRS